MEGTEESVDRSRILKEKYRWKDHEETENKIEWKGNTETPPKHKSHLHLGAWDDREN